MAGGVSRPFPPPTLSVITIDDAMSVACKGGVGGFIARHRIEETAADTSRLLMLAGNKESDFIMRAAGLSGYGDGCGYGDGYGYGYGDGDGYGYGYGYGDGNGYGYGDGDGYGGGDGYGYGDGYGDSGGLRWLVAA